ncbi:Small G protein signaling modulator 1 [Acipenser ruthenus]|uniref:Small G protein signaling modulator 1 n=1 Tax=Acipenser ruthenus TaxID=7906 RepID=A0A444URN4_ACIRT|nr:Small G protein signaling modulator 1 [Acipenser ruthenus]
MEQGAALWHPTARKSSCSSCSQNGSSDAVPPNGCNHERAPLKMLCDNMKYQIISRAFYGWLAYCRHMSTVRTHLSALVNHTIVDRDVPHEAGGGLTAKMWQKYLQDCKVYEEQELLRLVYFGGVEPTIRREVWPFLLGHYQFGMSENDRKEVDDQMRACYEQTMSEWLGCEAIVRQREKEQHAAALAKCSSGASLDSTMQKMMHRDSTVSNEVFESAEEVEQMETEVRAEESVKAAKRPNGAVPNGTCSPDSGHPSSRNFSITSGFSDRSFSTEDSGAGTESAAKTSGQQPPQALTKPQQQEGASPSKKTPVHGTEDADREEGPPPGEVARLPVLEMQVDEEAEKQSLVGSEDNLSEEPEMESLFPQFVSLAVGAEGKTEATSPVSSIGVTYSQELLDMYTINLHRIEKDVQRCDRNYWYFTPANLEKLRNIMCSYIWQHLEIGYVQGMCDLLAPLLVILDDGECPVWYEYE